MTFRRGKPVVAALLLAGVTAVAGTDIAHLTAAPATRPAARAVAPQAAATPSQGVVAADLVQPTPVAATPHVRASRPHAHSPRGLAPDTVAIPRQGVVAPVGLCSMADGELEPPSDVARTCRWAGGADLGDQQGTVALTGHINWVGQGTGAFGRIGELRRGDTVLTADAHGAVTRWRVTSVEFRDKSRGVDLTAFTGAGGPRTLFLISCGGPFDPSAASYLDNIYVRARPIPAAAAAG